MGSHVITRRFHGASQGRLRWSKRRFREPQEDSLERGSQGRFNGFLGALECFRETLLRSRESLRLFRLYKGAPGDFGGV